MIAAAFRRVTWPITMLTLALLACPDAQANGAAGQSSNGADAAWRALGDRREIVCGKDAEHECLGQAADLASRDGGRLRLKLLNGRSKIFATTEVTCRAEQHDKCRFYRLQGIYPELRLFLVRFVYSIHGSTLLLVSGQTGEYVSIDEVPKLSPSGRRLAIVSATESDGVNSVEILSVRDGQPVSGFRHVVPEGIYALYEFVDWDGDHRLKMQATIHDASKGQVPIEAVWTEGRWTLSPDGLDDAALSRLYAKPVELRALLTDYVRLGRMEPARLKGALAAVLRKQPEQYARIADVTDAPAQAIVVEALRLAGMESEARDAAERWKVRSDPSPLSPLATLKPGDEWDRSVAVLWGAALATGDASYLRPIFDRLVTLTQKEGVDATLVVPFAFLAARNDASASVAFHDRHEKNFRWISEAGNLVRTLDATAREHRFVGEALLRFVNEAPESKAAKALLEYARRRSVR